MSNGHRMVQKVETFRFETSGRGFLDITSELARLVERHANGIGLLTVFLRHTSASLTIQENADPDVLDDLMDALDALAPRKAGYRHTTEGADDMPAHIRTMLTGCQLSIPITHSRLALGTWQAVYLIEHRDRPHTREVVAHLLTQEERDAHR